MKYYLHDTSAFQDEKISQLFIKFGYEGIGLFFTLLEKIALQEKPVNSDVLKKQLFIGKRLNKCWNFMEEIGLICTKNGETFNENILNFSEKYQIKKEKTRKKVSEWRKKQKDTENVTGYKKVRNQPKVKESKVKESNYKNKLLSELSASDFENPEYFEITISFWELFKKNVLKAGGSTSQLEKARGNWVDQIRLLIESDKQNIDSVRTVFVYLQNDDFWKKNILSTKKLREKFNTLLLNARHKSNGNSKTQEATSYEELRDILSKHFD